MASLYFVQTLLDRHRAEATALDVRLAHELARALNGGRAESVLGLLPAQKSERSKLRSEHEKQWREFVLDISRGSSPAALPRAIAGAESGTRGPAEPAVTATSGSMAGARGLADYEVAVRSTTVGRSAVASAPAPAAQPQVRSLLTFRVASPPATRAVDAPELAPVDSAEPDSPAVHAVSATAGAAPPSPRQPTLAGMAAPPTPAAARAAVSSSSLASSPPASAPSSLDKRRLTNVGDLRLVASLASVSAQWGVAFTAKGLDFADWDAAVPSGTPHFWLLQRQLRALNAPSLPGTNRHLPYDTRLQGALDLLRAYAAGGDGTAAVAARRSPEWVPAVQRVHELLRPRLTDPPCSVNAAPGDASSGAAALTSASSYNGAPGTAPSGAAPLSRSPASHPGASGGTSAGAAPAPAADALHPAPGAVPDTARLALAPRHTGNTGISGRARVALVTPFGLAGIMGNGRVKAALQLVSKRWGPAVTLDSLWFADWAEAAPPSGKLHFWLLQRILRVLFESPDSSGGVLLASEDERVNAALHLCKAFTRNEEGTTAVERGRPLSSVNAFKQAQAFLGSHSTEPVTSKEAATSSAPFNNSMGLQGDLPAAHALSFVSFRWRVALSIESLHSADWQERLKTEHGKVHFAAFQRLLQWLNRPAAFPAIAYPHGFPAYALRWHLAYELIVAYCAGGKGSMAIEAGLLPDVVEAVRCLSEYMYTFAGGKQDSRVSDSSLSPSNSARSQAAPVFAVVPPSSATTPSIASDDGKEDLNESLPVVEALKALSEIWGSDLLGLRDFHGGHGDSTGSRHYDAVCGLIKCLNTPAPAQFYGFPTFQQREQAAVQLLRSYEQGSEGAAAVRSGLAPVAISAVRAACDLVKPYVQSETHAVIDTLTHPSTASGNRGGGAETGSAHSSAALPLPSGSPLPMSHDGVTSSSLPRVGAKRTGALRLDDSARPAKKQHVHSSGVMREGISDDRDDVSTGTSCDDERALREAPTAHNTGAGTYGQQASFDRISSSESPACSGVYSRSPSFRNELVDNVSFRSNRHISRGKPNSKKGGTGSSSKDRTAIDNDSGFERMLYDRKRSAFDVTSAALGESRGSVSGDAFIPRTRDDTISDAAAKSSRDEPRAGTINRDTSAGSQSHDATAQTVPSPLLQSEPGAPLLASALSSSVISSTSEKSLCNHLSSDKVAIGFKPINIGVESASHSSSAQSFLSAPLQGQGDASTSALSIDSTEPVIPSTAPPRFFLRSDVATVLAARSIPFTSPLAELTKEQKGALLKMGMVIPQRCWGWLRNREHFDKVVSFEGRATDCNVCHSDLHTDPVSGGGASPQVSSSSSDGKRDDWQSRICDFCGSGAHLECLGIAESDVLATPGSPHAMFVEDLWACPRCTRRYLVECMYPYPIPVEIGRDYRRVLISRQEGERDKAAASPGKRQLVGVQTLSKDESRRPLPSPLYQGQFKSYGLEVVSEKFLQPWRAAVWVDTLLTRRFGAGGYADPPTVNYPSFCADQHALSVRLWLCGGGSVAMGSTASQRSSDTTGESSAANARFFSAHEEAGPSSSSQPVFKPHPIAVSRLAGLGLPEPQYLLTPGHGLFVEMDRSVLYASSAGHSSSDDAGGRSKSSLLSLGHSIHSSLLSGGETPIISAASQPTPVGSGAGGDIRSSRATTSSLVARPSPLHASGSMSGAETAGDDSESDLEARVGGRAPRRPMLNPHQLQFPDGHPECSGLPDTRPDAMEVEAAGLELLASDQPPTPSSDHCLAGAHQDGPQSHEPRAESGAGRHGGPSSMEGGRSSSPSSVQPVPSALDGAIPPADPATLAELERQLRTASNPALRLKAKAALNRYRDGHQ